MKRIAHISDGFIVNVSLARDDAELQPGTMLEADALAAGYTFKPPTPEAKRWPDTEYFLAEFSLEEMAQIGLSTEPTIAGLRFLLSGWRSAVHADDPRVQQGLDALVAAGILTPERRAIIVG